MINLFVSLGTHEVGFDRLCQTISNLSKNSFAVKVQQGANESVSFPDNFEVYDFITPREMASMAIWSDILVSQASPGVFRLAWESQAISICLPRKKVLKEAVDDHQFDFANFVQDLGGTRILPEFSDINQFLNSVMQEKDSILQKQLKVLDLFDSKIKSMCSFVSEFTSYAIK